MRGSNALWAVVYLIALGTPLPAFAGTLLITPEEARLPSPSGAIPVVSRGITRGPHVELSDIDKAVLHSPIHLQIKFQSFGGANIDLDSLQVMYLKAPTVDLTARLKPFIQSSGIDVPDAELPPGEHTLRVSLRDSDGRTSTTSFVLKVSE